ncbi:uncharacterized protein A1O5_06878 [Cladophialophora psammophila CBS 110553]|uniref:Transcription factor domain-containing protein n=1 Tax=Cladophialophora psammophila CBS 110553 TaxID=1182543 RepID=W9WNM7_9EURO|nr:uncharacterized protein A1O5_06878 [Cladophialophora psammophila CBS 110553]EXJ69807.1 hypothetical protein A1O5_06878 [Cladophialophora psammophila CBS 110553]
MTIKGSKTRSKGTSSESAVGSLLSSSSINLLKGNSDPFNAYPVKINPEINELIAFYRDYLLPAQYHVPSTAWVSSANAKLDWTICISTLQEPTLAKAFIARSATVAAVLNPALRTLAMRYRLQSIQELRVRLLNHANQVGSDIIILQIIMLQKAEIVDKNLTAAAAHAKILQNLFQEQQRRNRTVNFTLLQYALWSDTQVSSIFMTPLAFDVGPSGWVVNTMQPLWAAALEQLRSIPQWTTLRDDSEKCLDPSVEGAELKAFFISRRTTLQTWLHYGLNGLPVPPLIMLWLTTTACLQQGRMIKHYIQAVHKVIQGMSPSSASGEKDGDSVEGKEYWYTQQYLILAEFVWTHHLSYKVEVCGIDLFDMVPTQLKNLRAALERAEDLSRDLTHHCSPKYQNARLWALFIGAHAEWLKSKSKQKTSEPFSPSHKDLLEMNQAEKKSPRAIKCSRDNENYDWESYREISNRWFSTRLARQVRDMKMSIWEDVYPVLRGFNYADVIQPLGEEVFNQAMDML